MSTTEPSTSAGRTQSTNPFGALINQEIAIVPSFTLESGVTLHDIPVAYKTWGKLNARGDNVLVICHALTGSADVEDWYVRIIRYLTCAADETQVGSTARTRSSFRPDSLLHLLRQRHWVTLWDGVERDGQSGDWQAVRPRDAW